MNNYNRVNSTTINKINNSLDGDVIDATATKIAAEIDTKFGGSFIKQSGDVNNVILPDDFIWGFIAIFVVLGLIFNLIAFIGLLKTKCSGLLYIILQITLCDISLLLIAPLETFYTSHQFWLFPPELCPFYMGLESFAATAIFYFIIAANFHSISTYNLAINEYRRLEKETDEDDDDDGGSEPTTTADEDDPIEIDGAGQNEHSNNDNYEIALHDKKRSLTIDYRKRKYSISVLLPVLFIWFLSASVSFPLFMFSNVIPNEKVPKICGLINFNRENNILMRYMILAVKIVIPTIGLVGTMANVGIKLVSKRLEFHRCELVENVYGILKLSFVLSLSFCLLSVQRFYGSLIFELSYEPLVAIKYPTIFPLSRMLLVFLFYGNSTIRPVIYWMFDASLRRKTKRIIRCQLRSKS